jgi:CheY-like chemotaxis protein
MPDTKLKVLVVDDDPDIVTYLEMVLRDNGYEPMCAGDGTRGLAMARQRRPDLICLDIAMPEPTGVRVYRELRDDPELKDIPVVMITGVQKEFKEFIHHRKKVPPPDGYISKPFDVRELLDTLSKLLKPAGAPTGTR